MAEPIKVDSIELPVNPVSPGMTLLTNALLNVEQVLQKADEALSKINQNLNTLTNQRIGLAAQRAMLVELRNKLETDERAFTIVPLPTKTPDGE